MKTSIFKTLMRLVLILISGFGFCYAFYWGYQLVVKSAEYDPMTLLITFPILGLIAILMLMAFGSLLTKRNLFKI